jgi:hypothetical protein
MIPFYIDVARTAFRRQLIYRWANLAGLFTNTFFAVIGSYVVPGPALLATMYTTPWYTCG